MALSEIQRLTFANEGIVRLADVFSEADAARMVHGIWRLLTDKYGVQPDSPATWTVRK